MDRGVWWTTVQGPQKVRLSTCTQAWTHTHTHFTLRAISLTLKYMKIYARPSVENSTCHILYAPNRISLHSNLLYSLCFLHQRIKSLSIQLPKKKVAIIPDSPLSLIPFPIIHQSGSVLTLWNSLQIHSFYPLC